MFKYFFMNIILFFHIKSFRNFARCFGGTARIGEERQLDRRSRIQQPTTTPIQQPTTTTTTATPPFGSQTCQEVAGSSILFNQKNNL